MDSKDLHLGLLDLLKDPSQMAHLNPSLIPALLLQLGALQSSMAARLAGTQGTGDDSVKDTLVDVEDAAERLGVSEDWLYRRTSKLPFVVRVGRHVRFSSHGIDRFIRNRMRR